MFRRTAFALLLSVTTFTLAAHAAISGSGPVSIKGQATGLGSFTGTARFSVTESDGKLVFSSNLKDSLNMGVRDDHTRKAFKVGEKDKDKPAGEGAKVLLTIEKSKVKLPESGESKGVAPGRLKMLGKEKDVKVDYTVTKEGAGYKIVSASFSFNYPEFGVAEICKVICVKPQVTVSVSGVTISQ